MKRRKNVWLISIVGGIEGSRWLSCQAKALEKGLAFLLTKAIDLPTKNKLFKDKMMEA